jgi:hypothetical protein
MDHSKQTTGMRGYQGEASWHVFAKGFKMIVIVTHDRKCPNGTSWLARFSRLSGFNRETGDRAIVLADLDLIARLESGDEVWEMKLGFG